MKYTVMLLLSLLLTVSCTKNASSERGADHTGTTGTTGTSDTSTSSGTTGSSTGSNQ